MPLRVDLGEPVQREPVHAFVVADVGEHRLDRADALAVQLSAPWAPTSRWVLALRERSRRQKAIVTLANKNARILWAVLRRGDAFDAKHVSVKRDAPVPTSALTSHA